jgi:hypothetical protein
MKQRSDTVETLIIIVDAMKEAVQRELADQAKWITSYDFGEQITPEQFRAVVSLFLREVSDELIVQAKKNFKSA